MSIQIRTVELAVLTRDEKTALVRRSAVPDMDMRTAAAQIVARVRQGGDEAL